MSLALLLVAASVADAQMVFPWAKTRDRLFHFEERQSHLLDSLRSDLHLDVLADKLPVGMTSGVKSEGASEGTSEESSEESSGTTSGTVYVRNSESQKYICRVRGANESITTTVSDRTHSSGSGSGSGSGSELTTTTDDESMVSFQKAFGVIDRLKNVCMINAIDWWSYEWCHRKEVKQFHLDVDHKAKKHFRNPEWSLGTYVYSDYYSAEFDEETVEEVVDYYEDGQMCDETGEGRKTEVHIRCCSEDAAVRTYKHADGIPPDKVLEFQQIRETKTCNYQIDLCTPLLCEEIQHADHPDKLKPLTLLEFADQFRHVCSKRQENWWNYEACFGGFEDESSPSTKMSMSKAGKNDVVMGKNKPQEKFQGIRQFHVETILSKTDKANEMLQKQVVQAEFVLGRPPLRIYKNESALSAAVHYPTKTSASLDDNAHSYQPKLPSLHLEFTDGSDCDIIENVRRSSTVEITCGDRDFIEDIIEDRTCHYVIKMISKLICRVDGFSPPKKEVSELVCTPIDGASDSRSANELTIDDDDTPDDDSGIIVDKESVQYMDLEQEQEQEQEVTPDA